MDKPPLWTRITVSLCLLCIICLSVLSFVLLRTVSRLGASLKETSAAVGNIDYTMQSIGEDLNDARNVLGLRTNNYGPEQAEPSPGEIPGDEYTAYYNALDQLLADFNESMLKKGCSYFMESKECAGIYRKYNLTPVQNGRDILLSSGGRLYYKLTIQPYTTGGKVQFDAESYDKVTAARISSDRELDSFIQANNSRIKAHYASLEPAIRKLEQYSRDQKLVSWLQDNRLYIKTRPDDALQTGFDIRRADGSLLCSVLLNLAEGTLTLGTVQCQDTDQLWDNLLKLDTLFDLRTVSEKKAETKLAELSAMVKDPAFIAFVENKGYSIAQNPVQTQETYDFSITDRGGFSVGTLSLEKDTGEVYLFDSDNILVSSVKKN